MLRHRTEADNDLRYVKCEILTPEQRQKTHFFDTFFYENIKKNRFPSHSKKHANMLGKDFIIVPINENLHWFLAIICFPRLYVEMKQSSPLPRENIMTPMQVQIDKRTAINASQGADSETFSEDCELEIGRSFHPRLSHMGFSVLTFAPIIRRHSCILIFDSLDAFKESRGKVVADNLRKYLRTEYQTIAKTSADTVNNIPEHIVKVPHQNNLTDCGLYLLQYVEKFFRELN